jgi:hypothetical protein
MTVRPAQLTFNFHACKDVVADFHGGQISSDAGLLPLIELDRRLGWTEQAARCLTDPRQQSKVKHTRLQLLRQRFFGLIAGYEDCNDHNRLKTDPILKAASNKPMDEDLASQPTFSRLENTATAREVTELNRLLCQQFIQVHGRQRLKRIVLDIDTTDDPCHGHQQRALFNGFYGQYMYLPLLVYERESGMLVGVRLQSGNASPVRRAVQLLKPIIKALRKQWPNAEIVLRGDAAFGCPQLYDFCEPRGLGYLFGLRATKPLKEHTNWALTWVKERHERTGGPQRHVGGFRHQAGTWPHERRVLYKVEANDEGTNRRFMVTNLKGLPAHLHPFYNDRGTAETFIDDCKNGLNMDRLSCGRFVANAFRLVLTALAYNLMRMFRGALVGTTLESATTETIRSRLIKIGARVRQTARRIWVHLSSAFPLREVLARVTAFVHGLSPPLI